jgi:hypothetical protein
VKYFLLAFAIAAVSAKECSKKSERIPECVQQKIDSIKALPKWNPPAEVHEYNYQGQQVFLFTSPCCDQYIVALNKNCEYICAPSGGYTGKGDGKCADFYSSAAYVRLVWKDAR